MRLTVGAVLVVLLLAASGSAVAAQESLELLDTSGGESLILTYEWAAEIGSGPYGGLGFDGTTVSTIDSTFTGVTVVSADGLHARPVDCWRGEPMWISSAGLEVVFSVAEEVYRCDVEAGHATRLGRYGQVPSAIGRGDRTRVPVTSGSFGRPPKLLLVDWGGTITVDSIGQPADPAHRDYAFGPWNPIAVGAALLVVGQPDAPAVAAFSLAGEPLWRVTIDGFTRSPYTDAELDDMVEALPEQVRESMRRRFRSAGRPLFGRGRFDVDGQGHVWIGLTANEPRQHFLLGVRGDGRTWFAELAAAVHGLAAAGDRVAIVTGSKAGRRVRVYRLRPAE